MRRTQKMLTGLELIIGSLLDLGGQLRPPRPHPRRGSRLDDLLKLQADGQRAYTRLRSELGRQP